MSSPASQAFWIIIPSLNAEGTLGSVLERLRRSYPGSEVVVVDDGSSDSTRSIAEASGCHLVVHDVNRGVGRAIKSGVAFALERGAAAMVTMGADDQRDLQDVGALLAALHEGSIDIVIGSKFLGNRQKMPLNRRLGNYGLRMAFNFLFRTSFTDVTSGFRAFGRKVAEDLEELSDGYGFDVDLCARMVAQGHRWREVPVRVFYRGEFTRMRSSVLTGLQILALIVRRWIQSTAH